MKKVFLTLAMVAITLTSFAKDITKKINISAAQKELHVSSFFEVNLKQSSSPSMTVTVSEELDKYVVVKVTGGKIVLGLDAEKMPRSLRNQASRYTLIADISMKDLAVLKMSGASHLSAKGTFNASYFDGEFSGATTTRGLRIESRDASFDVSGASNLDVEGNCEKADFDLSGASNVKVDMNIGRGDFDASGASNCKVNGDFDEVEVDCSGACKINFRGKAKIARFDCSGASKIDAEDFEVEIIEDSEASGASNMDLYVTKSLDIEITGASSVYYTTPSGTNPQINLRSISRGSTFKRR